MSCYHVFETAHGFAAIAWTTRGVSAFRLPAGTADQVRNALLRRMPEAVEEVEPPAWVTDVIGAARRYFQGEPVDFSAVSLDLGPLDPLFSRIYDRVRRLGRGETTTYGGVARDLGERLEVARAVGQAMAHNPVPLIVPCHRVLAAGGKVGGFSAPGGSDSKVRMLALEGVHPAPPPEPKKPSAQTTFTF
jgi:methylated-DNA-[protein]-cysteine S-methyltransferase